MTFNHKNLLNIDVTEIAMSAYFEDYIWKIKKNHISKGVNIKKVVVVSLTGKLNFQKRKYILRAFQH